MEIQEQKTFVLLLVHSFPQGLVLDVIQWMPFVHAVTLDLRHGSVFCKDGCKMTCSKQLIITYDGP